MIYPDWLQTETTGSGNVPGKAVDELVFSVSPIQIEATISVITVESAIILQEITASTGIENVPVLETL